MAVEHVNAVSGKGMGIIVPRSKGDHTQKGRRYKAPADPHYARGIVARARLLFLNINTILHINWSCGIQAVQK